MVDFNKAPCIYWSNKLKCEYLQRFVLVHSIIYYELNSSIISDKRFDDAARQLISLSKETDNYNDTEYYYCFKDFTGETGFYLYDHLNEKDKTYLLGIAKLVLEKYKKEKSKCQK